MTILPAIEADTVDAFFADPPFNLKKDYGGGVDDNLSEDEYLAWCAHLSGRRILLSLQPAEVEHFARSAPRLFGNDLSSLDRHREFELPADTRASASLTLLPTLLYEGKTQGVPTNPHTYSDLSALRW